VKVSGSGNLKLFSLPSLVVPNTFEMYEPEFNENIRTNQSGMRGSISNSYAVVPQNKGSYTIRPLTFSYFDLETESYKTLSSAEIPVEVLNGPQQRMVVTDTSQTKQNVVMDEEQFKYI